jgi:hypothetical protein
MANEKNLIPQSVRTKDEQREIARKGGIASGAARRHKRDVRNDLVKILDSRVKKDDKSTYQEKIVLALVQRAMSGDVHAFEVIRDTLGESASCDLARAHLDVERVKAGVDKDGEDERTTGVIVLPAITPLEPPPDENES